DNWLEAMVDWQKLLAYYPAAAGGKLPKMQLTLGLKADNIRTKAVLEFPEPLNLTLAQWNIPTNIIRDPLASFTAIRGIAPWLGQIKFFQDLKLDPLPDQLYGWAMAHSIFENYLA